MDITKVLIEKPGYLKWSASKLAKQFKVPLKVAIKALNEAKNKTTIVKNKFSVMDKDYLEFLEFKKNKLKENYTIKSKTLLKPFLTGDKDNVLVIGDLHEPFCLDGYLEFCRAKQEEYNCGTVIFIGDIIDNHYTSYHESEMATYGPNQELQMAIDKIANWYKVFPVAYVCIGNHDRMVTRKAKTAGIADGWVKDYSEVLQTPNWKFVMEIVINNVCYNHGEAGEAATRMLKELISQVQGHLHSKFYIQYGVGARHIIFGAQVGCGIDRNSFAFAYGKNGPKPAIGCMVNLNKGTLPILLPMEL